MRELSLPWRFVLLLLCVLASVTHRRDGCPPACACYSPAEVHCTFRYLSRVPTHIQPAVERINLGYNSLSALTAGDFSGLQRLELLMLHSNVIRSIEEHSFQELTSLQVLKMSYNRVEKLNKDTFRGLESLVRLHMDHNLITFIHPESFYGLKMLQLINLEGNLLQQLHPDTFITLRFSQIIKWSSLKTIYLSDNALTTLPETVLAGCSMIENLFLSGNPWSCDCRMGWLAQWIEKHPGVLKCKRERKFPKDPCPVCEWPLSSRGSSIVYLQSDNYTCTRPWIHAHLKQKNSALGDGDYTAISSKDFVAPIGSLEMNITDQFHNDARIACVVQKPTGIENINTTFALNGKYLIGLSAIISTSLICNIDHDNIRDIWNVLATYSDSPMNLERGSLLSSMPHTVYSYRQVVPSGDSIFTEIEAKIKASPDWLMQGTVMVQLDRFTTTFPTLSVKYSTNVQVDVASSEVSRDKYGWAMIKQDNQTKTEHTVLAGGAIDLNCQNFGNPKPTVEWILPNGSKFHAPYISEDQRIVMTPEGRLTLQSAEISDTGAYHCVTTNYLDADVLTFRVTVLSLDIREEEINGIRVSHNLGQDLVLDCTSTSSPQASVQWILPDHTVLDKFYSNRILHKNGSLIIHGLTSRDTGFYRCLAGNLLGTDLLNSEVIVRDDLPNSTKASYVNKSNNHVAQIIDNSEKLGNRYFLNRVSEESRSITSGRPYNWPQSRFHKDPAGKRGNGRNSKRVRNTKYQKEDTISISKSQIKGEHKKKDNLELSKALKGNSDDSDAASGDGIYEEFIVMATTKTPEHKPVRVTPNSNSQTPATPTLHTLINYGTPKNEATSHSTKSDYKLSISEGVTTNRPSGKLTTLKPTLADVNELLFSGDSDDDSTGATPLYNFQIPNVTYVDPKSQTIFTVTTTEEDREKITFQTTQRIKSELLPGSTIISKHQIQIIPSKKVQSGKRRMFNGRRRIIRPSKITDIQSLLNKFKHLSIDKQGNLTFSETADKITDCGDRKQSTSGKFTNNCRTSIEQSLVSSTARYNMTTSTFRITEKPVITERTYTVTNSLMLTAIVQPISEESSKYFNTIKKELAFTTTTKSTTTASSRITQGKNPFGHKGKLTDEEPLISTSTAETYKATSALPTNEIQLTHINASPLVTRETPKTSFDDSSGSSFFAEANFSDNVVTPSKIAEIFSFPAFNGLSTTTESTRASHILAAPPTMRTELKQDSPRNNFSGSQNGSWGKRSPGYHRQGFRRRKPIKKITSKSPVTTATKIAGKFATTTPTTISSQAKHRGGVLKPQHTPLKHSERSPSPVTARSESVGWRDSFTIKSSTISSESSVIALNTTVQPQIQSTTLNTNMMHTPKSGWRYTTQTPMITTHGLKHNECFECPQTIPPGIPRSRTVASDKMTGLTTNTITPPYGSSNANQNAYDHSTRIETTSIRHITSKPTINGGKAASFTILSNSDAFLPCQATGNPEPNITWNRFSSSTGNMLTIKGKMGKFEVLKNGTLFIQRANIKDRGQYICFAQNEYGSDKLVVTLSVVAYPTRILETKMREIKVLAGITVHLDCRTEGRPVPVVSWILPNHTEVKGPNTEHGRVTVSTMGTLTIQEVSVLDRGHYKCIASNPGGTDTASVNLEVAGAAPVILEEKKQLVKADTGQNLFLPCTTYGDPQPTIHWVLHDGTILQPLAYSKTKFSVFANGTLYLRSLGITESGKYECIATSSAGSEHRVVTLSVKRAQTAPRITKTSQHLTDVVYGGRLHLNCSAVGYPKPQIMWQLPSKTLVDQSHRMGSRIKVLENGTLIIESVNEKDSGDFFCVARNSVGDDVQSMRVSVSMTPARIEPNIFSQKQVPYGKDLKVDCVAAGVPMPEISWGLPDGTLVNSALQADETEEGQFRRYILFNNGTLYLNQVGTDEEGDYICYAENNLGKDKMHIHISVLTAVPHIERPNLSYARVKPGGNIRFDCMAIGEPKPKIFWMLPSKDIIAASNERYLVHANGSLDIQNIRLADAGEYVCMARNTAGEENKVYKLDIDGNPPIINGLNQNRTVVKDTAIKYSRKLIDCMAKGDPAPKITWIMPDNIFLTAPYYGSRINVHNNGTLEIRNVRPSDTAEFICMAQNDGGEAVMVVQLDVTDTLRRPIFKNPFNEKVVTQRGRTAALNCSADGQPTPEIMWTLPNRTQLKERPRLEGSKYYLNKNGTLFIYNSCIEDAGKYRCAAKNKAGYIEKLVVFEVIQKPYILTQPKGIIRALSGESVFLHCLTEGILLRVSWTTPGGFILSRPQGNGRYHLMDNGTLVVREATLLDRGNYVCRAKNDAGEAVITVPVIVIAHPPRITNGPPSSLAGVTGVPINLKCFANGIPTPEITWELPDRSVLSNKGKGRSVGSELLQSQGTLIIRNPTPMHSGNYKCIAFNYLGRDFRTTYVTII